MRPKLLFPCGFLILFMWPIVVTAQVDGQTNNLRAGAVQALDAGDTAQTIALANALLARDSTDVDALMTLSLAQSQTGDHAAAAATASRAYQSAKTSGDKLQAARLAAGGLFQTGHYTRAEWWLRRAANHAQSDADQNTIATEFRKIRDRNPLSVQLGFSAAPSSNINGGAEDESLFLGEFELILPPESLALSGIEYASDVLLSYRLSQSATQRTSVGAYLYGRTYQLSPETRRDVPDIDGSDFALTLAEVSLTHQRYLFDLIGPTGISGHVGIVDFGGNPLWEYQRVALTQDFDISPSLQLAVQASYQDQVARDPFQPDTTITTLTGFAAYQFGNSDVIRASLAFQQNDAEFDDNAFTDTNLSGTYDFADPVFGAQLSVHARLGYTWYDEFSLALFGREDRYATLGGTIVLKNLSYFGFSPSMSLTARRTKSNVDRFTSTELQGRVGIESNF